MFFDNKINKTRGIILLVLCVIVTACGICDFYDLDDVWFLIAGFLSSGFIVYLFAKIHKLLWYKKLILNKYKNKKIKINFNAYDSQLKCFKIIKEAEIIDHFITDNQNIIFHAKIDEDIKFYFRIGLFYRNMILCDRFGKAYDYKEIQISPRTDKLKFLYQDIEAFRKSIPRLLSLDDLNEKWTIDPDSFNGIIIYK